MRGSATAIVLAAALLWPAIALAPAAAGITPNAARAVTSLRAMDRALFDSEAGDYRETVGMRAGSHAWPFSQAIAAHIAVKRVVPAARIVAVRARLAQLEARFRKGAVYAAWPGGDIYLDDNEWLAEDLLDWNEVAGDHVSVLRAGALFASVAAEWDRSPSHPCAGGVFWTDAADNHDRNTVSTANGALLALRLYGATGKAADLAWAKRMLAWIERCMRGDDGLYWDHIDLTGNVDRSEWSYNQGSVIGAYVELYRVTHDATLLRHSESIADAALAHFDARWDGGEPAEFAAVFFRNLLALAAVDGRTDYVDAAAAVGDRLWSQARDPATGLFHFGDAPRLLEQAAVVQLYAALARAGR